ncbi:MAG: CHRD domain-containing protein [Bauldia sp.]
MKRLDLITAAAAIATAGFFAFPANAEILNFTVNLTADQVVPSPTVLTPAKKLSDGKGSGTVTYDTTTKVMSWDINYSGLSGPATSITFHGPADKGRIQPQTQAPLITQYGNYGPPLKDDTKRLDTIMSPAMEKALTDGMMYVMIKTSAYPLGEVRGQIVKK